MLSERIDVFYRAGGTPAPDSPLAQRARAWHLMIQSSTFADALTRVIQHENAQQTARQRAEVRARLQQLRVYRVLVFESLYASYILVPEEIEIAKDVPNLSRKYLLRKDLHEFYLYSADTDAVSDSIFCVYMHV